LSLSLSEEQQKYDAVKLRDMICEIICK